MRILAAALVAAFFMAAPASAQILPRNLPVPCSGPELLPGLLARDFGETLQEQGLAGGALVQLWRSPDTGSWTILMVLPDGLVCALASGEDWMAAVQPPETL